MSGIGNNGSSAKFSAKKQLEYEQNPRQCIVCGAPFPYKRRNDKGKFCCNSCAAHYNNLKRPVRVRTCQNCGKQFRWGKGCVGKFCSAECGHSYKYNQSIKSWLAGESSGTTLAGGRGNYIRRYLIDLHNGKCQVCGWGEINPYTKMSPLEVHHIDGNHLNNSISNLVLICPNCHS
jgi:hypothetical protein